MTVLGGEEKEDDQLITATPKYATTQQIWEAASFLEEKSEELNFQLIIWELAPSYPCHTQTLLAKP